MKKMPSKLIATADCETDPFEYQKIPKPFVWGFYSDELGFENFWDNDDCCDKFIDYLYTIPPHIIYMHNGGKFDLFFLLEHLTGNVRIVNGRILECHIGPHTIRDSYAAVPIPLSAYKKDDIDYNKLKKNVRDKHRTEILKYLRGDCTYLYELITAYITEFGNVLTIGSAALKQLREFHQFDEANKDFDDIFRQFYSGGRNQCFATGIIKKPIKVYDVNSMYPSVMRDKMHPTGVVFTSSKRITSKTDFAIVRGKNYGALPLRTKTSLDFTAPEGIFYATRHEIEAAEDTGTFKIEEVIETFDFITKIKFDDFVNHFYDKRLKSNANGDQLHTLFYKLILNSAYGKFCTNPDNFEDWYITEADEVMGDPWYPAVQSGDYILWAKESLQKKYYNVATGASITGASRAKLLYGLAAAKSPLYCDTDSIFCEHMPGAVTEKILGEWMLEKEGDLLAIGGKKLYALFKDGECVKKASKGVRLDGDKILSIAGGDVIEHCNDVPAFKLNGDHQFTKRIIRLTAKNVIPFGF